MKKIIFTFFSVGFLFILVSHNRVEAKLLPRAASKSKTSAKPVRTGGTVIISPKLGSDRRSLVIYFSNLNLASSITYSLSYKTDGLDQGVGGSIDTAGTFSTSRTLLFGTESSGVKKYHSNITGAKLEVIATLKSGKKLIKRYKIRV